MEIRAKVGNARWIVRNINILLMNALRSGLKMACEVNVGIYPGTATLKTYIHTHNNACPCPIFSPEDLKTIADLIDINETQYPQHDLLDPLFSFCLLTDNALYVLVISDLATFKNFMKQYIYDSSPKDMIALSKLYDNYKIKRTNASDENEKIFLQFLKEQNNGQGAGVRLLKANNDITGFNEIALNRAGTALIPPIPCN